MRVISRTAGARENFPYSRRLVRVRCTFNIPPRVRRLVDERSRNQKTSHADEREYWRARKALHPFANISQQYFCPLP